ncbi:hypothetical protein CFP56_022042 [Quercus suber]|uniref:Uncharacterized protein n=1 Tax=Quercus suber TaxID=58331 RepID=A0AAW0LZE8_QUESU
MVDACETKNAQLKKKIGLRTLSLRFIKRDCQDTRRENDMEEGKSGGDVMKSVCFSFYHWLLVTNACKEKKKKKKKKKKAMKPYYYSLLSPIDLVTSENL